MTIKPDQIIELFPEMLLEKKKKTAQTIVNDFFFFIDRIQIFMAVQFTVRTYYYLIDALLENF